MNQPLLSVDDLRLYFPIRAGWFNRQVASVRAVDGVSFHIAKGETFGLVGESGSGKSTLGRAVLRLLEPTRGTVEYGGQDLAGLSPRDLRQSRKRMQMVFQNPFSSLDPRWTVGKSIAEPLVVHGLGSAADRKKRVQELLEVVGLDPRQWSRHPHEFSGGQRQRVGIARALAASPDFIVCDEAVSALDVSIRAQIMNLLMDLRERLGLTYLFIAHDLALVEHLSDRVGVMYLGKLVEVGPVEAVYSTPAHPYTKALISAIPIPNPKLERARRRIVLTGDMPSPTSPPPGCRFHTRCWLYEELGSPEVCRVEEPTSSNRGLGHVAACHFSDHVSTVANGPK